MNYLKKLEEQGLKPVIIKTLNIIAVEEKNGKAVVSVANKKLMGELLNYAQEKGISEEDAVAVFYLTGKIK